MKYNKYYFVLIAVLCSLFTNSMFAQTGGMWIIPPDAPPNITPAFMDSLNIIPNDPLNPPGDNIGQDIIGKPMFFCDILSQDSASKKIGTSYICGELHWVKMIAQVDTNNYNLIEYSNSIISNDSTGNEFWTVPISVSVVSNSEIIINSPENVKAKLYEAYDIINPNFSEFNVIGSNANQSYLVNMKKNIEYIITFIKDSNKLVYASRIK